MKKFFSLIIAIVLTFVIFTVNVFAITVDGEEDLYAINQTYCQVSTTETTATLNFSKQGNYYVYDKVSLPLRKPVAATKKSCTVQDLIPANTYTFEVYEKAGNSERYLFDVNFRTKFTAPKIYTKYRKKSIIVSWEKNSNLSYELYRKCAGGDFEFITDIRKNKYVDTDIKGGWTYEYYLLATDGIFTFKSNISKVKAAIIFDLPNVSGKTKTYAYYTAVTARNSPQYALLNSDYCYTDYDTGIRMVGDCYCIALGSYYGTKIGTKYHITLSSGNEFNAILCDQKADRHTDANHQYAVQNKDIIEFYVERGCIPKGINGDYGRLPQFSGSVVSIEKI